MLRVLNGDGDGNTFVEVDWEGKRVQMFAIDLRERSELVQTAR
jgi:hypothetical protein